MDSSGVVTPLHDFSIYAGPDGTDPVAPVFQASDGNLYGTAQLGGLGYGTIFRLDLPSGTFSLVHQFDNRALPGATPEGSMPVAPLVQGADGIVYGTAFRGGSISDGTVFALTSR